MISVELSKRFKKIVRAAGREAEVSAALKLVIEGFGNPHAHSGLSIRKPPIRVRTAPTHSKPPGPRIHRFKRR